MPLSIFQLYWWMKPVLWENHQLCVSGGQKMSVANHYFFFKPHLHVIRHICNRHWSWLDMMLRPETLFHRARIMVYTSLGPLTISANDLAGSSADWILLTTSCSKRFQSLTVFGRKLNFSISVLAESLR